MSIIYCERHNLQWDSDKKERCPQCEVDNSDIVADLLAALETIERITGGADSREIARVAIAKAKGEA